MFFKQSYEVKYSDLDADGNLKLSTVLELLQDISVRHADESEHNSAEYMKKKSLAWLVSQWNVKFVKKADRPKKVTAETCIFHHGMTKTKRQYKISADGELIAFAVGEWFLFNAERQRPVKIPPEMLADFEENENITGLDYERVVFEGGEKEEKFRVLKKDIDTNVHLNNVRSFEYTCEALDNGFYPERVVISYKHSAYLGDKTELYKYEDENEISACLKTGENDIVISRFFKK